KHKVRIGGRDVEVTVKEFELLLQFARNPGHAFSRQELLNKVWGYQFDGYEHTVNTHINRLRSKIEEDPSNPVYLKTVWGVGYRFAEPEEIEES
ncbi:MAG: winged helix-turn-helix domain-containing protein, partial [Balneolaceae bacterium]|nr:winged helix-turn-helix domain-containing protein [Balneolaceae bacterium]